MEKHELEETLHPEVDTPKKKKKGEIALFIISIIMASIAVVLMAFGVLFTFLITGMTEEPAGVLLLIIFCAVPFIFGIAAEVFGIISFSNALALFIKVKNAKSITMFVIGCVELLFLPIIIVLFVALI